MQPQMTMYMQMMRCNSSHFMFDLRNYFKQTYVEYNRDFTELVFFTFSFTTNRLQHMGILKNSFTMPMRSSDDIFPLSKFVYNLVCSFTVSLVYCIDVIIFDFIDTLRWFKDTCLYFVFIEPIFLIVSSAGILNKYWNS